MCPLLLELTEFVFFFMGSMQCTLSSREESTAASLCCMDPKLRGQRWEDKLGTNGVLCWPQCCTSKQTSCRVWWAKQCKAFFFSNGNIWGILVLYRSRCVAKTQNIWWPNIGSRGWCLSVLQVLPSGLRVTRRNLCDICSVMNFYSCAHACTFNFPACLQLLHNKSISCKMPK